MPTRTRPPDLLARQGQDTAPAESAPGAAALRPGSAAGAGDAGDAAGAADWFGAADEPPWAGLRLVAVPGGWPPYDCDAHGTACPAAAPQADGMAMPHGEAVPAMDAAPRGEGMPATGAAPPRETMPRGKAAPLRETAPRSEAAPREAAEPSLAAAWPGQFGQVLVEILAGFRPAKQLAPWTTERVRTQIDLLSCAVATEQRPSIRRVMTSRPAADVVEMTMVVSFGPRLRALAIRFERIPARPAVPGRPARPARWLCTEIETS